MQPEHISKEEIRRRIRWLIDVKMKDEDPHNVQLPVMVYIQMSCIFGDITEDVGRNMTFEYLKELEEKHRSKR